jgi:hypothetical protein
MLTKLILRVFNFFMFAGTSFFTLADPLYSGITPANLESVRKNTVWDNLFVDTPGQAKFRRAGVLEAYLGGDGMRENFIYGRPQGKALNPGSTVTVTRQQMVSGMKFYPKAYVSWLPVDDWYLDDGQGGGVVNSGPAMIFDEYQLMIKLMTKTINTMLWMDNFRHGQASGTGISDNRIFNINGLDEALNNGIDVSPFGNIYSTFGGATRNGVIGAALNSTPLWLGGKTAGASSSSLSTNGPGQIDVNALMVLWSQGQVTGGQMDLGLTNVFGFAAIAVALDAQRRDTNMKQHDIAWKSLDFNGVEIYADPLAPSAQAGNFLTFAPTAGKAGNNNLADGAGVSTATSTVTTPQFTSGGSNVTISPTGSNQPSNSTLTVGEVLYFLTTPDFRIRDTDKSGWNFGLRRTQVPNNVSTDNIFERLGTNMYNPTPRRSAVAFGFSNA